MSQHQTNIIDDLNAQLDRTTDRAERYELLMSAVQRIHPSNPAQALELISSAKRLAKALREPRRSGRCDHLAGHCEYYLGRYPEALKLFQRALKAARDSDYQALETRALQGIGLMQMTIGEYLQALESLNESLRIAESLNDITMIASAHNLTGIVFRHLGDHGRAIAEFHKSITLVESIGGEAPSTIINLGTEYLTFNDYDNARISFERGISIAMELGIRRSEGIATVNLGATLSRLNEFDEAQRCYDRALEIFREMGDPLQESQVLRSIGVLRRDMEQFNESLEVLQASYEISQRIGDATGFQCLAWIGEAHANLGDLAQGVEYALRALEEAQRQGDRDGELSIHADLAEYYELLGNLPLALHHHKLHATLKEEVKGLEHQRELHQMRMRAEVERAERERVAAELRARELEAEMERKTKELTAMALQMVEKNTFLEELKRGMSEVAVGVDPSTRPRLRTLVRKVEGSINVQKEWRAFEEQFEKVHQGFLSRLAARRPDLTPTELKICALVKLDLPTKEIADILRSSARTVEWHRSNVRRKLGFAPDANLTTHFASL
jgi:tetratricopeptide (TPR) repeat protein/DNA-binding CsgD family transcriptional regulator